LKTKKLLRRLSEDLQELRDRNENDEDLYNKYHKLYYKKFLDRESILYKARKEFVDLFNGLIQKSHSHRLIGMTSFSVPLIIKIQFKASNRQEILDIIEGIILTFEEISFSKMKDSKMQVDLIIKSSRDSGILTKSEYYIGYVRYNDVKYWGDISDDNILELSIYLTEDLEFNSSSFLENTAIEIVSFLNEFENAIQNENLNLKI
jgi:hypothetical protein